MENRELIEFINTSLNQMKSEKSRIEPDMLKTSALLRHRVHEWNSRVPKIQIYSSTPIDAINTCIRGVAGYLLSPSIRWFKFITRGKNFESSDSIYMANDWLELVTTIMYTIYNNSSFYATSLTALEDAIITGTSYEMITDKLINGQIIFECYNPYECYISENDNSQVDTFFREYKMTANQAYKKFGESLPNEVINLVFNKAGHTEIEFVHAIFPRKDYKKGSIVPAKNKKFASVHYCKLGDSIVKESGFDEFPVAVHRWKKNGKSAYGYGLAMQYLPEIQALNDLQKQYSTAVQFQVSPVIQAPEVLKNRFIYRPGAINFASPSAGKPEIVTTQLNIQYLAQQIEVLKSEINRLLFADLFNVLMRQERQRTAYEVQELKGEGLILLSAIIGNMQVEKLNPLVLRTFKILARSGKLPTPPEELVEASQEGRVEIELDGPLAQTMKAYHQATGLEQGLAAVAAGAQIFPNELVQFNAGEILRQYATAKGLPQTCIREISEVKKIKEKQLEDLQAQSQQQQALAQSEVLKNMGYNAQSAMDVANNQNQMNALLGGGY